MNTELHNQTSIDASPRYHKINPKSKIPTSNTSKINAILQSQYLITNSNPINSHKYASINTKSSTIESLNNSKESKNDSKIEDKYLSSLYNKYNYLKGKLNKEGVIRQVKKSQLLTPIPSVKKKENEEQGRLMNDAITNAIVLRRLEYDEYIKNHKRKNSKKRKYKNKYINKKIQLVRKPSFDEHKVVEIQKMYKGFSTRVVNKSVYRLKVRLCLIETFCLLVSERFEAASKRLALDRLKKWFHEPFIDIDDEVGFRDKLQVKLCNNYYSFRHFNDLNKTIE